MYTSRQYLIATIVLLVLSFAVMCLGAYLDNKWVLLCAIIPLTLSSITIFDGITASKMEAQARVRAFMSVSRWGK
jgi:cadmium resistance protein CadD (predicted permease)